MTLSHAANPGRHFLCQRGDDLYETPACATEALLRAEKLPIGIWECACGRGAIASVLSAHGHKICTSDLVDYGAGYYGVDFLMETKMPLQAEAIVTNPPYRLADQFVRHALTLCPHVIMLLRLAFLESERRSDILDSGWLRRVHIFKRRLPMMHRDGWTGRRASNSIPFAWFVWDRTNPGPTEIKRISWMP